MFLPDHDVMPQLSSPFFEFPGSALPHVPPQKIPDRSDPHILTLPQDRADHLMFPGQPTPLHPVLQYEMYTKTVFSLIKALSAAIFPALHCSRCNVQMHPASIRSCLHPISRDIPLLL